MTLQQGTEPFWRSALMRLKAQELDSRRIQSSTLEHNSEGQHGKGRSVTAIQRYKYSCSLIVNLGTVHLA